MSGTHTHMFCEKLSLCLLSRGDLDLELDLVLDRGEGVWAQRPVHGSVVAIFVSQTDGGTAVVS